MARLTKFAHGLFACGFVTLAGTGYAQEPATAPAPALGLIKGPSVDEAKALVFGWINLPDAAAKAKADQAWTAPGTLLDRSVRTLAVGHPSVATTLADLKKQPDKLPSVPCSRTLAAAPRANLVLFVAKHLADHRRFEEAHQLLSGIRPESVVEPATYYFYKAVCENRLVLKEEGLKSVHRLLNSVADVPERYKAVASLMQDEMDKWEGQDLGYVARRMEEIEGRLETAKGGPKTQEKQKEVVDLLDKMIEELESQCQGGGGGSSGQAPQSSNPAQDSKIMGAAGPGNVDKKKLIKDEKVWGKMPEKEKVKALEALSRGYPPHFKEAIEGYTKKVAEGKDGGRP